MVRTGERDDVCKGGHRMSIDAVQSLISKMRQEAKPDVVWFTFATISKPKLSSEVNNTNYMRSERRAAPKRT